MKITQLCLLLDFPFGNNGAGAGNGAGTGTGTGNGVGTRPGGFGGGSGISKENQIFRLKHVNYRKHSLL